MAKKQQQLSITGIELRAIGIPAVTALSADGLARAGLEPGAIMAVAEDLAESAGPLRPGRFVIDWATVGMVVPDRGEGFIGPLPATIIVDSGDVDRLLAGLRSAGWAPA